MLPAYSETAKRALPAVTKSAYKLFVFFEDADAEYLYEEILEKLGIDISDIRVLCLTGKDSLLAHRSAKENKSIQKKTLYVLDKDLDDLLLTQVAFFNVFYLDRYSIENYFLEEAALLRLALEEKPKLGGSLSATLAFEDYFGSIRTASARLASLYFLAQKFSLPIENTSEPIQRRTVSGSPWLLCAKKVEEYADDISSLLAISGCAKDEAHLLSLLSDALSTIDPTRDMPGKQLVDLIRPYLGHMLQVRGIAKDSFCYRLARLCDFHTLHSLKAAINRPSVVRQR